MQRQITPKQRWLKVENTISETHYVNVFDIGLDIPNGNAEDSPDVAETIEEYIEGEPDTWENIQGYGARLSAPGYLDCTDWAVFGSKEDAEQYLNEQYPEDEEDEDED
jgi:hypothetical protein